MTNGTESAPSFISIIIFPTAVTLLYHCIVLIGLQLLPISFRSNCQMSVEGETFEKYQCSRCGKIHDTDECDCLEVDREDAIEYTHEND